MNPHAMRAIGHPSPLSTPDPRTPTRRTCGAAMVTALLAISLAMLLLASMMDRLRLDLRRTSNIMNGQQMFLYALGGESMARLVLEKDFEDGKEQDTLFERWAQKAPVYPLERGGLISGRVEDLQGRFNLNNLIKGNAPNKIYLQRLRRILLSINAEEGLADAVVDWIDTNDDINGEMGAENEYYLSLEKPYHASNKPFLSTSELMLIKGFDAELVKKLEPWVTVLPEGVGLNVNTATPIQIESLHESISKSVAESVAADRDRDGYKELNRFMSELNTYGTKPQNGLEGLGLSSQYFMAEVTVKLGGQQMRLRSFLHRSNEGVVTVSHRIQDYF